MAKRSAAKIETNMQAILKDKEATLRTASVGIQALTVDSKQVTLSLFRQIPTNKFVDRLTGQQLGKAWGCVNYFWKEAPQHDVTGTRRLHVVWQDETTLFRDLV